jgi:hypothetical protein
MSLTWMHRENDQVSRGRNAGTSEMSVQKGKRTKSVARSWYASHKPFAGCFVRSTMVSAPTPAFARDGYSECDVQSPLTSLSSSRTRQAAADPAEPSFDILLITGSLAIAYQTSHTCGETTCR